jgi:hypothetical protein
MSPGELPPDEEYCQDCGSWGDGEICPKCRLQWEPGEQTSDRRWNGRNFLRLVPSRHGDLDDTPRSPGKAKS